MVQLYTTQAQMYVLQMIGKLRMKSYVAIRIDCCADRQNEDSESVVVQ
jgi:hypothetical protein